MKYVSYLAIGLLVVAMLFSGTMKVLQLFPLPPEAPAFAKAMAATGYFFQFLGLMEVIGGVLLIIPRFRLLGAAVLLPITVNILLFHLFLDPAPPIPAILLLLANGFLIWQDRQRWLPLVY